MSQAYKFSHMTTNRLSSVVHGLCYWVVLRVMVCALILNTKIVIRDCFRGSVGSVNDWSKVAYIFC